MLEQLFEDIEIESYQSEDDSEPIVDLATVKRVISKHSYLKLGDFLQIISPHQLVAIKAVTSIFKDYDAICTAKHALNTKYIQDSFKNILHKPFDLNVAKIYVRTDLYPDTPILYILVN